MLQKPLLYEAKLKSINLVLPFHVLVGEYRRKVLQEKAFKIDQLVILREGRISLEERIPDSSIIRRPAYRISGYLKETPDKISYDVAFVPDLIDTTSTRTLVRFIEYLARAYKGSLELVLTENGHQQTITYGSGTKYVDGQKVEPD